MVRAACSFSWPTTLSMAEISIAWRAPSTWAPSRRSKSGRWLSLSSMPSPRTLASSPFCADSANTCSTGRSSVRAVSWRWRSTWARICAGVLSSSHKVSILFNTTKRVADDDCSVARCSRQIDMSERVTPVSAPSTNTTAWAWGIRLTVSSGSAPMAFNPGVSSTTKPCFSKGWAMLISAWRQRGTSTSPWSLTGGLSSGCSSCQKPNARASSCET